MSGHLPRLVPRPLAPAGSVGGDVVRGRGVALELFPRGARPAGDPTGSRRPASRAARLSPEELGASTPDARERLERILAGEGVLVSTGQQPVLFLGPLYVLYKLLTAVAAAERLSREGVPSLALFWIASDDHDWPEVGRTRLLDTRSRLRTLELTPPEGRQGRAVGPSALPDRILDLLDDLKDILPSSEFVGDYLELFRDAYRPGRSVAEAFSGALTGVTAGLPFAWVDAASPEVRRAGAPLLGRALEEAEEVAERLGAGEEEVRSAGYEPQLTTPTQATTVFVEDGAGRVRLHLEREGDTPTVRLGRGGETRRLDALLRELETDPRSFSPNVALRPVVEAWLLPVAASVLGPAEVAYWAQLGGLFDWAGIPMPRVHPRHAWAVLEGKVGKVLEKLGAEPGDFEDGGAALEREVTQRGRPERVDEALADAREQAARGLSEVADAVAETLPGIRSAVGAAKHKVYEALDELDAAVDARVRERQAVLLEQIQKAAVHLHPDGRPQERVLNPLYYLARYGEGFVELVAGASRRRTPGHPEEGGAGAGEPVAGEGDGA